MRATQARLLERFYDPAPEVTTEARKELLTRAREGATASENREIDAVLAEQTSRHLAALQAARTELERLKAGPRLCAVVVEAPTDDGMVKVSVRGAERCIPIDPAVDTGLQPGDAVLLNADASMVLARTSLPRESSGQICSFVRWLGNGEMMVRFGGQELSVRAVNGLHGAGLQPGHGILFDPLHKFAHSRIEESATGPLPFEVEHVDQLTAGDIGGLSEQYTTMCDAVTLCLCDPALATTYRMTGMTSILMTGRPGCGKTLLARAVGAEAGRAGGASVRFVSIKPSEWTNSLVGATEERIRESFGAIRRLAAAGGFVVLFFDEVESFGRTRGLYLGSRAHDDFTNALLAELDGIRSLDNLVVIGATNRPDLLDPAMRSRLASIVVEVPRPTMIAAREILGIHLRADDPWHGGEEERWEAIETALSRLYAPNAAPVCRVKFSDNSTRTIRPAELTSGRLLMHLATAARRTSALRHRRTGAAGIRADDVAAATDRAIAGLRRTLTRHNAADYLDLPQDLTVVAVEPTPAPPSIRTTSQAAA